MVSKIVKPFTPANNSDEVARDTKSASGQTMHSREMPDIAARLEEIFKIPQSALRQSEVDILTQELLKHRTAWIMAKSSGGFKCGNLRAEFFLQTGHIHLHTGHIPL